MEKAQADKIKQALKPLELGSTHPFYYDKANAELRVKIASFVERWHSWNGKPYGTPDTKDEKKVTDKTLEVLRAMEDNGFRPPFRREQKTESNDRFTADCRYIVFR